MDTVQTPTPAQPTPSATTPVVQTPPIQPRSRNKIVIILLAVFFALIILGLLGAFVYTNFEKNTGANPDVTDSQQDSMNTINDTDGTSGNSDIIDLKPETGSSAEQEASQILANHSISLYPNSTFVSVIEQGDGKQFFYKAPSDATMDQIIDHFRKQSTISNRDEFDYSFESGYTAFGLTNEGLLIQISKNENSINYGFLQSGNN